MPPAPGGAGGAASGGHDDDEEWLQQLQSQASAGYFEFNAGAELGAGLVGRYLCLDLGADRQSGDASDRPYAAHERGGGGRAGEPGGAGGGGGSLSDIPTVRQKRPENSQKSCV